MAGDTLRGIGKKAIAEALEAAAAAEHAAEPNGTAPGSGAVPAYALAEDQGRPERSLDELPSERTGLPEGAAANHSGTHALAAMPITTAPTLVQDAPAPVPGAATLPGTSTLTTAATTVVDDAAPLGSASSESRSGPNRVSFGTMIGHEMHAVQARVAAAVAEADAAARGTAHGHDVHLPAHSAMAVEGETALVVAPAPAIAGLSAGSDVPASHADPASVSANNLAPARDSLNEFSGGDHSFFSTEPINDEYEPENPRGRLYTRLAVSGAVFAVVAVVVVAWVNSHSASEEPPPVAVKTQPAVSAPAPVRTAVAAPAPARPAPPPAPAQEPPTSTIPSSMPERIAVTTPPPHPAKAPSLAPPVAEPAGAPAPRPAVPIATAAAKPAAISVPAPKLAPAAAPPAPKPVAVAAAPKAAPVAATPAPKPAPVAAAPAPVRELRTPPPPPQKKPTAVAAAAPHPPAPPAPRAAAPPPPPPAATHPAPTVAKAPQSAPSRPVAKAAPARASKAPARGKQKYDPDGTLPLSFE